jgi:hypothetical protein
VGNGYGLQAAGIDRLPPHDHRKQLRAKVDVHIHYLFELESGDVRRTRVNRWLILDVAMPIPLRPLRRGITDLSS